MKRTLAAVAVMAGLLFQAGCTEDKVTTITPQILIERTLVDFGAVRQGNSTDEQLRVKSQSRTQSVLTGTAVEDEPSAPGGGKYFSVVTAPPSVEGEGEGTLALRFKPLEVGSFEAVLVVKSDDPDAADAEKRIRLKGEGAVPKVKVVAECLAPCKDFQATAAPLAIDFGLRPTLRKDLTGKVTNEPVWPTVSISNEGKIELNLLKVAFEGDPVFAPAQSIPSDGVLIGEGQGQVLRVVFNPPQGPKTSFAGTLVITTDDPEKGEVRVALSGKLAPNQPPSICAAIVQVDQPDGTVDEPKDPLGKPLFGAEVPVQPGGTEKKGVLYVSAFQDHFNFPGHALGQLNPPEITRGDQALCTFDPEDGRAGLKYTWTVLERPPGSNPAYAKLTGAMNPEASFKPDAIGRYKLQLDVKDPQGLAGKPAIIEFDAIPRRDIVVQLGWDGQPNIDLDVHLVKPGPCGVGKTDCIFDLKGDINGYSNLKSLGMWDWGTPGSSGGDDPRLDLDAQGNEGLLENVNLNHPENDPACRDTECKYEVFVHYFQDRRTESGSGQKCPDIKPPVTCKEGDNCGCAGTTSGGPEGVCVSAKCVKPVYPVVKVYLKPTPKKPDPDLVVPIFLGTPPPLPGQGENFSLPGPCFMWHVATITWPSAKTLLANPDAKPTVVDVKDPMTARRVVRYYGKLSENSFACEPSNMSGEYLPGTPPEYK